MTEVPIWFVVLGIAGGLVSPTLIVLGFLRWGLKHWLRDTVREVVHDAMREVMADLASHFHREDGSVVAPVRGGSDTDR